MHILRFVRNTFFSADKENLFDYHKVLKLVIIFSEKLDSSHPYRSKG